MRLRLVMAMLSPSKSRASSRGKWDLNSRIVAVFIVRHYCVTSPQVSTWEKRAQIKLTCSTGPVAGASSAVWICASKLAGITGSIVRGW